MLKKNLEVGALFYENRCTRAICVCTCLHECSVCV